MRRTRKALSAPRISCEDIDALIAGDRAKIPENARTSQDYMEAHGASERTAQNAMKRLAKLHGWKSAIRGGRVYYWAE